MIWCNGTKIFTLCKRKGVAKQPLMHLGYIQPILEAQKIVKSYIEKL